MRRHRAVAEQVVVVHGATSGVGRATVLEALRQRARVTAVDADPRALAALAAEAAAPHRLEPVLVDGRTDATAVAERITDATTTRFGLLHSWVHVTGRDRNEILPVGAASGPVLRQLRRSGGGAFVVVAPEPEPEPARLATDLSGLRAATSGAHDVVSVTLVRRAGIVAPDRVAQTALRATVRPRPVARVRELGPPRRAPGARHPP